MSQSVHRRGKASGHAFGRLLLILCCAVGATAQANAQASAGIIRGRIKFEANNEAAAGATVILSPTGRVTQADEYGAYEFTNVPAGRYQVVTRVTRFPDAMARVDLTIATEATADLTLRLAGLREEVTVTASNSDESTINAIHSTEVLDSIELTERAHTSIGEVLENQPGIAKRSFGPGAARPVIRGFDGDRVLVLQDNLPIGSLGSQSGDHGEPINVLSLERVEVVRGPATLLYGSSSIGGVVNTITNTNNESAPTEPRGFVTGFGGSALRQAGGSAGFDLNIGRNFSLFANGGGQRTGDYDTPVGRVPNSFTRSYDGTAGFGYFGKRGFFRASATYDERLYGVPFAGFFEGEGVKEGEAATGSAKLAARAARVGRMGMFQDAEPEEIANINLRMRRSNFRFNGGLRNLESVISGVNLFIDYTDYQHKELEGAEVGTIFNNDQFNYRTVLEQKRSERLTGRFGASGFHRNYETIGAETLAPPVQQNNFAAFALEEINFERLTLQFGGRVETNRYRPGQLPEREAFQNRTFTGFSGSAGARFSLFDHAALIANYTHSSRAPSLEELYNFGPHIGNLTFEVGNQNLRREFGNGMDASFRYSTGRTQFEANAFYYDFSNYVYLAPTGDIEDGLTQAVYAQADARYYGSEISLEYGLVPNHLNLSSSFDAVRARIKDGPPLPRIPPVHARIGLEFLARNFRIQPEAIIASEQDHIFPTETRTAGYGVFNLRGSYTLAQKDHFAHIFTINAFNLGDKLYRNHLSFIKEFAPEVGRGVKFVYTVRFF